MFLMEICLQVMLIMNRPTAKKIVLDISAEIRISKYGYHIYLYKYIYIYNIYVYLYIYIYIYT